MTLKIVVSREGSAHRVNINRQYKHITCCEALSYIIRAHMFILAMLPWNEALANQRTIQTENICFLI